MLVKTLNHSTFAQVVDCFLEAFQDYFVPMPTDPEYYRNRWKSSQIEFDLSFGMYDGEKLVGFILHGIDKRGGELVAYNAGTGVIAQYRGQRIVKRIYEEALPILKSNGVTRSILEVITKNDFAIRAYEKVGFEIRRTLLCFQGEIEAIDCESPQLHKLNFEELNWADIPNQELYSWDFHRQSLGRSNCNYFLLGPVENPVAFIARQPDSDGVAQIEILDGKSESWDKLACALKAMRPGMKAINVDERLSNKISWMKRIGLVNYLDQYEMELEL